MPEPTLISERSRKHLPARQVGRLLAAGLLLALSAASKADYSLVTDVSLVGAIRWIELRQTDTLAAVAQREGLGYLELRDANPSVDPWLPDDGTRIVLPTAYLLPSVARNGAVINLAEYRMYVYSVDGKLVHTYPIGIGRDDFPTPQMTTQVVSKTRNPSWTPPTSIRAESLQRGIKLPPVVPPGPNNPLGELAIRLARQGYLLHGTNKPFGIGQAVSHGCIRLYNADIHRVAKALPTGSTVRVVNEPYKIARVGNRLYLEAHRNTSEPLDLSELSSAVVSRTNAETKSWVDWSALENVAQEALGWPHQIGQKPRQNEGDTRHTSD